MLDYGYSSSITGNPAWLPIVLLFDVPSLAMDLEMGLWPRPGSPHNFAFFGLNCHVLTPGWLFFSKLKVALSSFASPILFPSFSCQKQTTSAAVTPFARLCKTLFLGVFSLYICICM